MKHLLDTSVISRFAERILPLDPEVCLSSRELQAQLEKQGRPILAIDDLIAATAIQHQLLTVARNTRDMEASGVQLFDPGAL